MEENVIRVREGEQIPFHNHADYCVGTGRMGLALQQEYQEQLALVQREIGFSHIRGHGLFCEDMAIYQEYEENGVIRAEYNFTYLDLVMDSYQRLGMRPFLELGFMPKKLASGTQTIFYWEGNTTPPRSEEGWKALVQATLRHLMERYGTEEVVQWPIEVWNEPNLPGFWENADMDAYFGLFSVTFKAVKELDDRFRVGGPAICGVDDVRWMRCFLEYCRENQIRPDFVTRHHYNTEVPEHNGHYGYAKLTDPEMGFANLRTTRDIVDSFPEFAGLEIHLTEFNTSYIPNCPMHDTNLNAAYVALQLSRLGDDHASYSYWTFGDIFEENGVPFTPFHGGFGLVANGCIPKPTFWTFAFFKKLQGTCVHRSDHAVIVRTADGGFRAVLWNLCMQEKKELELTIILPVCEEGVYSLAGRSVQEDDCNPLKVWHDLGEPSSLSPGQKKLLRESAVPRVFSARLEAAGGQLVLVQKLTANAVAELEIKRITTLPDRGYSYERVMSPNFI